MVQFKSVNLVMKIVFLPMFVQLQSMIFLPYRVTYFEVLKRLSILLIPVVDAMVCCPDPPLRMEEFTEVLSHLHNCRLP